jgi:hypothetical protein
MPARRHVSSRLCAFLLVAAAAILAPTAHVLAQGTSGSLPDPISGRELTSYARRLDLSPQQRLAIDGFHDEYLEQFRTLCETEIAEFLEESGNVMRSFMFSPDVDAAKKTVERLERVLDRIRVLDEGLFDRVGTLLSEEQAAQLPRARQARERQRNSGGFAQFSLMGNPGARVDLSEIMLEIDAAPEDVAAADPLLRDYETQLTSATRSFAAASRDAAVELAERMAAVMAEITREAVQAAERNAGAGPGAARPAGPGGGGPGGPPGQGRGFGAMRDVMAEVGQEIAEEASKISALNRRAHRELSSVLSEDARGRLRAGYWMAAYPDVYGGAMEVVFQYDAALELAGLEPTVRDAIAAGRTDLEQRQLALAERIIDVVDEQRKEAALMRFGFGGRGERSPEDSRRGQLEKDREEINRVARETLASLIGAERIAEVEGSAKGQAEEITVIAERAGGPGIPFGATMTLRTARAEGAPDESAAAGDDRFLPPPIGSGDVRRMADRLALDAEGRELLEALHLDYEGGFAEIRDRDIAPILAANRRSWAFDRDSGEIEAPGPEEVDRLYELRRTAFDAIRALDDRFFEDVRMTILAEDDPRREEIEHLRVSRDRIVYGRAGAAGMVGLGGGREMRFRSFGGFGESNEDSIDLIALLEKEGLDDDVAAGGARGYEAELVALLRRRYERSLEYQREMDKVTSAMMAERGREGGERAFGRAIASGDSMRGAREEIDAIGRSIADLNRRSVDALAGGLEEAGAIALKSAYRRRAHPDIFADDGAAEPRLRSALAIEDLSESQRSRVADLLAEHAGPYQELCEKMLALRTGDAAGGEPRRDWARWAERRNEMEKLRFERADLDDKAIRRLRAILTEEQSAKLGLGPG